MRIGACLVLGAMMCLSAGSAGAKGRYAAGRIQYFRTCGPCFSMGWKWAPSLPDKLDLSRLAKKFGPAQVCTWMRRNTRKLRGAGCYPGRMTYRQKLNILYYVMRRARGAIRKPVLKRLSPRLSKRVRFKKTAPARRKTALQRHKNLLEMRKVRSRGSNNGTWSGSLKPKAARTAPSRNVRASKPATGTAGR